MDGQSTSDKSPLWIHPLSSRPSNPKVPDNSNNSSNGSYQVIQQLVTASPNSSLPEAEIETSLEAYVTPNGDCLWRRVAVWSGPTTTERVLHASFILPSNNPSANSSDVNRNGNDNLAVHEQPSLVCWAAFPERPNHKLLCVLVSPSTLTIWDVYPNAAAATTKDGDADGSSNVYISAEGHSVALPFQCCAIHPMGTSHGIMLERKEDQEDLEARKASESFQNTSMDIPNHNPEEMEDDEFFLKVPPRKFRKSTDNNNTNSANQHLFSQPPPLTATTPRTAYTASGAPVEVSSLFSLKHPLEDVLPVSLWSSQEEDSSSNNSESLVTDIFEKIIYTSTLKWTDHHDHYLSKKEYQQPICVTYNTILKRHAIWALKGAPAPAAVPPLWQRSRKFRATKDLDSHIGMLDQDLQDMDLLGIVDPTLHDHHHGPTRDEALADALGVRKTPRKIAMMEPRSRNHRAEAAASASVNRSGFMHPSRSMRDGSFIDADVSMADHTNMQQLLNLRPLSNLHPSVAIECLYEEPKESAPATNVFLTSNLEGSGLLVVGLVCPSAVELKENNPNTLQLLVVEPSRRDPMSAKDVQSVKGTLSESLLHYFAVKSLSTKDCIAAQPVQATPVPPFFRPTAKNRNSSRNYQATDLLVLKGDDDSQTHLELYRADCYLTDCALLAGQANGPEHKSGIRGIRNPVRGMIDFVTADDLGTEGQVRGCVSLSIVSSALAEEVLGAIESSIFTKGTIGPGALPMEFAIKFRSDCCRLEQALRRNSSTTHSSGDPGWLSVASLLDAVVDFEFFGAHPNSSNSAKKESNAIAGDNLPWESLLSSSFHDNFASDHEDAFFLGKPDVALETRSDRDPIQRFLSSVGPSLLSCLEPGTHVAVSLFDTLHFVYEDFKLSSDSRRVDHLRSVGSFLVKTCHKGLHAQESNGSSPLQEFLRHYTMDLGKACVQKLESQISTVNFATARGSIPPCQPTALESPPCILGWLDAFFRNNRFKSAYDTDDLSSINAACAKTRSLLRIFKIMFRTKEGENSLDHDYKIVSTLCEEGYTTANDIRDQLPAGIALPILEMLNQCSTTLAEGDTSQWTEAEFSLIGRRDLGLNNGCILLDAKTRLKTKKTVPVRVGARDNPSYADKDKDGLVPLQVSSAMLFPGDNRVKEAGRLLRSSTPSYLSVPRAIEVSDHEYERLKQNKLLLLCRRTLALSVGRGMLTIGSFQPVAAEPLPVPDLCMVGRIPPTNANLALDMSECQSNFKSWPDFHNGVAAGLRLPLKSETAESISKITRTWIVYNRPAPHSGSQAQNQTNGQPPPVQPNQSHAHGGLLLALGLRGHLAALEMTDIYDYLTQGQVTLTCGVLLGMAANKRGTCDISVSKMLCLHLPSLIPQHFSAIDVASPVQTAAVTGAGLLFQGSSHRMMTEFLLNEIGRRPESDVSLDREAYTLSCGIALGMVNICKGDSVAGGHHAGGGEGLDDLQIGERLYRYIVGGTDEEEVHRRREANDRQNLPTASSSGENERCSCVFEGDSINIDVTAAGATLALGLIFLRSENQNMAAAIALPDTHFLLEYVRPDFLALRVISRALIMWNKVEPSSKWIDKQLPIVIREAYKQMRAKMKTATDLGDMLVSDEESEPSMDGEPETEDPKNVRFAQENSARERAPQSQDYDCQAVRQIYVHLIAGACFALGLRYAGTADKRAAAAISERVFELQNLRDANDSVSVAMRPEPQILETCLGCCAISLALVQAGSGDLETLKLFKILRWRCDEEVKYGTHMSYGIAIGLLFLGGGTCTLSRNPEDIAALVAAFFPRFPFTTTDNQYHLQALRHLYALAVRRRDIQFVDVDTGEIVPIPIEIKYRDKSSEPLRLTAPCLFPNADGAAVEARIVSDRYYQLNLKLGDTSFGGTFYVKRRSANPYSGGDLGTQNSLLVQSGNFQGGDLASLVKSISGSPYILAFAKYMCVRSPTKRSQQQGGSVEDFCKAVLRECLTGHSDLTLPIYLRLRAVVASIATKSSSSPLFAWDFRLLRSFYEAFRRHKQPLLNVEKVSYLLDFVERVAENLEPQEDATSPLCLSILRGS